MAGVLTIKRITLVNTAFSSSSARLTEMAIPVMSANMVFTFSIWVPPLLTFCSAQGFEQSKLLQRFIADLDGVAHPRQAEELFYVRLCHADAAMRSCAAD